MDPNNRQANPGVVFFFVTMNITDNKLYVYSKGGMLRTRADYSKLCAEYGRPSAVSNNGQIFIFRQPKSFVLNVMVLNIDSPDGFEPIKRIDMVEAISQYPTALEAQADRERDKDL